METPKLEVNHSVRAELLNRELARIQKELKAPKVFKSDKYVYRNAEQILEAVKPLLGHLSLVLTDDVVLVGSRIYVKSKAILSDGVVAVDSTAFANEESSVIKGGQLTGATTSYSRKYALCGLFAIDSGKDLDELPQQRQIKPKAPITPNFASKAQLDDISLLGGDLVAINKYFKEKNKPFTENEASKIIDALKRKNNVV
jgi:hypothetical protein